jgi:hypothetical protein
MRRHVHDAAIAQWGCWALFSLLFEYKHAAKEEAARGHLAGDRGGFFAALLRAVTASMSTHAAVQPVQQCGAMATLAFVSLHGLSRAQASEVRPAEEQEMVHVGMRASPAARLLHMSVLH